MGRAVVQYVAVQAENDCPTAARAQAGVSNKNRMLFRTNQYLRKNGLRDPVWQKTSTNLH